MYIVVGRADLWADFRRGDRRSGPLARQSLPASVVRLVVASSAAQFESKLTRMAAF